MRTTSSRNSNCHMIAKTENALRKSVVGLTDGYSFNLDGTCPIGNSGSSLARATWPHTATIEPLVGLAARFCH